MVLEERLHELIGLIERELSYFHEKFEELVDGKACRRMIRKVVSEGPTAHIALCGNCEEKCAFRKEFGKIPASREAELAAGYIAFLAILSLINVKQKIEWLMEEYGVKTS